MDYVVAECRVLNGDGRPFDEEATRELVSSDVQRARKFASAQNHGLISDAGPWRERLPSLDVPTLVIHGTADPLFAVEHGAALAREIPRARMLTMAGAGHLLHPADWDAVAGAILDHTEPRGNVAYPDRR